LLLPPGIFTSATAASDPRIVTSCFFLPDCAESNAASKSEVGCGADPKVVAVKQTHLRPGSFWDDEYGCHGVAPKVGGIAASCQWDDRVAAFPPGRTTMKAAFGILVLYLSIPLAIVAAQKITAHEASLEQTAAHAVVAQALPATSITAKR
jgi:hypothetical protein